VTFPANLARVLEMRAPVEAVDPFVRKLGVRKTSTENARSDSGPGTLEPPCERAGIPRRWIGVVLGEANELS
jgi:hypothetical protein